MSDFVHAARSLHRAPFITFVIVATLGVGIGSVATLFSVFDAVWLRPLPFHEPDRLAAVTLRDAQGQAIGMSYPNFLNPGFITARFVPPKDSAAPRDVPQPIGTVTQPIHLSGEPGNGLPVSYIHTREAPDAQDAFDRYADRARELGWAMHQMIANHNPNLSKPEELAELLADIR